jgi:hypothetical protein
VPVLAGRVAVVVPAIAVGRSVVVPDVAPDKMACGVVKEVCAVTVPRRLFSDALCS